MKKTILAILIIAILVLLPSLAYAHRGRTDSQGGHHDYNNVSGLGDYHYHHGYPPHLHTDGVCQYDYDDQTGTSSSSTSSGSSSSQDTATSEPEQELEPASELELEPESEQKPAPKTKWKMPVIGWIITIFIGISIIYGIIDTIRSFIRDVL